MRIGKKIRGQRAINNIEKMYVYASLEVKKHVSAGRAHYICIRPCTKGGGYPHACMQKCPKMEICFLL